MLDFYLKDMSGYYNEDISILPMLVKRITITSKKMIISMQPIIALKEIKHFLKTRVQQLLRGWSCSRTLNQNNIFFRDMCYLETVDCLTKK